MGLTAVGMTDANAVTLGASAIQAAQGQIDAMLTASQAVNSAVAPAGSEGASMAAVMQQRDGFAAFAGIMKTGLSHLAEAARTINHASTDVVSDDATSAIPLALA